jgi:hypothetical protein
MRIDSGMMMPGDDGGMMPRPDAGPCPPGMICLPDSGRPPGRDSGPPPRDAGRDAGGKCPPDIVDSVPGDYCASSTYECIMGCTAGGTCVSDCIAADPSPDCGTCIQVNLIACFNRSGCQRTWDLFSCCVADNCPTPTRECAVMYCTPEDDDYNTCTDGVAADCNSDALGCFPGM